VPHATTGFPNEQAAGLVEHDLRHRLGDLADHPCEVASAPTAVDAVQAVDGGALEECVRGLRRLDAAPHDFAGR